MDLSFYTGVNFGAGLDIEFAGAEIAIDYAYRGTEFFDAVQIVTLSAEL